MYQLSHTWKLAGTMSLKIQPLFMESARLFVTLFILSLFCFQSPQNLHRTHSQRVSQESSGPKFGGSQYGSTKQPKISKNGLVHGEVRNGVTEQKIAEVIKLQSGTTLTRPCSKT